jgi:predicted nucleic acid-binding Zn ribbon protein
MSDNRDFFTPLKEVISSLLNSPSLPFNPADARIWEIWDETVGAGIAAQARPSWIRKGCLRVKVSDPIWLQELEFAEAAIMEKLNDRLGKNTVKKIEFRLDNG